MFNLGFGEVVLIAIVALVVLGPDKLPDTARALGKAMREFRRALNENGIDGSEKKEDEPHGR